MVGQSFCPVSVYVEVSDSDEENDSPQEDHINNIDLDMLEAHSEVTRTQKGEFHFSTLAYHYFY